MGTQDRIVGFWPCDLSRPVASVRKVTISKSCETFHLLRLGVHRACVIIDGIIERVGLIEEEEITAKTRSQIDILKKIVRLR